MGWVVACRPKADGRPTTSLKAMPLPQSYRFYLHDWTADEGLIPLNLETLEDQPNGQALDPGILSADGSTGVTIEYTRGRASLDPEHLWIVVYDLGSGAERNRFHPPASAFISDLSADGRRLLLRPDPFPPNSYPPAVEYYLVDTASGEQLAHLQDETNACFRQRAHLDPAGQRLYCLVDPALMETDGPQPLHLAVYDLKSGQKTAEIEVPQALIGGTNTERNGLPLEEFLEPSLVLSPNGKRLAIAHAESDRITLIEAQELAVERTFSLKRSVSLWELLAPDVAYAKGEMSGTIRQAAFSPDGALLYVFTHQVLATNEEPPEARGLWLVDLKREIITAETLHEYQIQWIEAAPDGYVYVFGTTDERLLPFQIREDSPSKLWRLDDRTLEIVVERDFTGFRQGLLVIDGA
jgi:hypothetical protein